MSEQRFGDDAARTHEVIFDPTPTEVRIFNPSTGTWSEPMPSRPHPKNLDAPDAAE